MTISFQLESCLDLTFAVAGFCGEKRITPLMLVRRGEQRLELCDSTSLKVFLVTGQNPVPLECIEICDSECIVFSADIKTCIDSLSSVERRPCGFPDCDCARNPTDCCDSTRRQRLPCRTRFR